MFWCMSMCTDWKFVLNSKKNAALFNLYCWIFSNWYASPSNLSVGLMVHFWRVYICFLAKKCIKQLNSYKPCLLLYRFRHLCQICSCVLLYSFIRALFSPYSLYVTVTHKWYVMFAWIFILIRAGHHLLVHGRYFDRKTHLTSPSSVTHDDFST